MNSKKLTIAIDGHSSCGKSTVAKSIAKQLGYTYIDTGAMYRAVTLYCIKNNIINNGVIDEEKLKKHLDNIKIHFT
jgi:cytidylate kinase